MRNLKLKRTWGTSKVDLQLINRFIFLFYFFKQKRKKEKIQIECRLLGGVSILW